MTRLDAAAVRGQPVRQASTTDAFELVSAAAVRAKTYAARCRLSAHHKRGKKNVYPGPFGQPVAGQAGTPMNTTHKVILVGAALLVLIVLATVFPKRLVDHRVRDLNQNAPGIGLKDRLEAETISGPRRTRRSPR